MAGPTDEILMAYADGALDAVTRAKVDALVKADAGARRRLEAFRATGAPLSKLYEKPMLEPVPAALREFVLSYPLKTPKLPKGGRIKAAASRLASGVLGFGESAAGWLAGPGPKALRWQLAAASAALMVAGAGAGFLLSGGGAADALVAFKDGRIFASGALAHVLESLPSGEDARISGLRGAAVGMRATLTFKSKTNGYCREYEIGTPGGGRFSGLGCREPGGVWALQVHVAASAPAAGGMQPAGGNADAALDGVVDRLMAGDALGRKEEAAAIASGWK